MTLKWQGARIVGRGAGDRATAGCRIPIVDYSLGEASPRRPLPSALPTNRRAGPSSGARRMPTSVRVAPTTSPHLLSHACCKSTLLARLSGPRLHHRRGH